MLLVMEILIAHWEMMEKLILETLVLTHVMMVMDCKKVVPPGRVRMMVPGVEWSLGVDEVHCFNSLYNYTKSFICDFK